MQLTKNFTREEFDCKDGTQVPVQFLDNVRTLAINLQVLRDHIGEPVLITGSGYRTPAHNKAVGGAPLSQHLTASGGDINAKNYTPKKLAAVIEKLIAEGKMKQGGIGVYPGFVHYDIRGTKARW
ncbi:YcbK family protein [Sphingobacterium psychroaquaticum]|uniref:Peptidase M15 n=1 Tax=Sphingobacterium psychroaquaticum TaxID=561061 RepID=A0A1X7K3C5_9SPHI|nr:D-Ala-D-Ala carboxypeptidase family metallohydrolase [Sphingobacterium psychroaquaticum]SMG35469.1 Peptidase M15 [Sphingobacterium psychroaquaticum]